MATRKLQREAWQAYFDRAAHTLGAEEVEIEVASLGLGSQVEAEWTILKGLSYDPHDDRFEVATDGLRHMILHPREVYLEDSLEGLHSVEIIDGEGNHQILKLRRPLRLPAP